MSEDERGPEIDARTRWSAGFLGLSGAGVWTVGMLLHGRLVVLPVLIVQAVVAGGVRADLFFGSWTSALLLFAFLFSGPVLVAMGGAMRFFAGVMTGKKVAGRLVNRIALWEWLRYELCALGFAMMFGSVLSLIYLETRDYEALPLLRPVLIFIAYLVAGLLCIRLSFRCGDRSKKYMAQVRENPNAGGPAPWDGERQSAEHEE